ncbi:[4Fe-4S] proteins maturation [Lignoscripta atroalba]|nr:[4Fe-4S] proteins maturation [Lignoscripta atroalba]
MNNLHTPVKACLRSASCEVNHFRKVRSLHRRWHNPTTFRHLRKIVLPAFLLPSFNLGNSLSYPRLQPTGTLLNPYDATPRYRRQFTTLRAFQAVAVTANPRKDEDGKDMIIDITPRAANRLHEIMAKDSNPALALRVTVESGGCHGFQYLMSLTSTSAISASDDTVFEASDGSGAKVVMDEPSLELLKGSKVDYTMELIGSQFKIVGNPAATSSCGCGTSFDIKT